MGQYTCTDLFAFLFFLLNYFLYFDRIYCDLWKYLFKILNVGMCDVVVFIVLFLFF